MKQNNYLLQTILLTLLLFAIACKNNSPEKKKNKEEKKETPRAKEPAAETKRGPVINISDTLSLKRIVLSIKDSAATMQRISMKLGEIYGVKLAAVIKKNNLKITGAPMAWYKGQKAPYFFEAGLPVDKKPARMPPGPGVAVKEIGIDSIVVAHFYGPYELIPQAYDALRDWLKDHKKTVKGIPYEIYVDDPVDAAGKPKDPYKVQTDIVFSWK